MMMNMPNLIRPSSNIAAALIGLCLVNMSICNGAEMRKVLTPAAQVHGEDWEQRAERFGGDKAETRPRLDTAMQFSFATEVREINARGGQKVAKGEVLMRARDAEIIAALDQQRLVAESDLEIKGAERALELAEFRFTMLKAGKGFSPAEFEELRVAADTARIQRDVAKLNLERQKLALKQLEGQAERYYLLAPFDGIVEEVMVEIGQGVSEQQKVLRLVNTDKLILDVYADTDQTMRLGLTGGSKAWVLVDVPEGMGVGGGGGMVEGVVEYVSPVADSVSKTRRVRVEIANTKAWPAGTQARVRFTAPDAQSADTRSDARPDRTAQERTEATRSAVAEKVSRRD